MRKRKKPEGESGGPPPTLGKSGLTNHQAVILRELANGRGKAIPDGDLAPLRERGLIAGRELTAKGRTALGEAIVVWRKAFG